MVQQFAAVVAGYTLAGTMALIAQAPDVAAFSSWIQYGALGILGMAVLGQLYIIVIILRDMRKDSSTLAEVLTQLRINCASQPKSEKHRGGE